MDNTFPYDAGRKKVDEQLKKLEAHLSSVYKQAASECQKELDEYLSRFRIAERIKRDQVKNGVITQSEYQNWARRQIFHTRQMQAKVLDLSKKMVNADKEAMAMINKELPAVYATSYNWGGFRGEKFAQAAGFDYTQFTIVNKDAVRVLATEDPDLIPWKPMPDDKKDLAWNRQHIQQAIEQGIVQGDGIDKISKRLLPVVNMDETAARRTARTAVNSIENKGRKDATDRVRDAGIPMTEVWSCTHDSRTRDTHILLDGTKPNEDGYFGEGILDPYHLMQYPSDPNGEPKEVYNCRCRLNSFIEGIDHSKDADLYAQFMSENYEEDWETVKRDIQSKELAYQANKAKAIERAKKRAETRQAEVPKQVKDEKAEPKPEITKEPKPVNESVPKTEPKDFTSDQKAAIDYYVSGDGMYLNDMLRGRHGLSERDLSSDDKKIIKDLDAALDKIVPDKVLFRNVDASAIFGRDVNLYDLKSEILYNEYSSQKGDYAQNKAKKINDVINNTLGKTYIDKGFVSTTRDSKIAENWGDFTGSENPVILKITPSAKTKGADVSSATDYLRQIEAEDPQKETLLARNQRFKIIKIYAYNHNVYIDVDIV